MVRSRATEMLFTCSLRCTDQVTSTHSRAKLSPCNRNPRLNCALYSDISLTSCTHTTSARKLLHFCVRVYVCSVEAHPLAGRREVAFPTKHCSRAKMAPRKASSSIWRLLCKTWPDELQMPALCHGSKRHWAHSCHFMGHAWLWRVSSLALTNYNADGSWLRLCSCRAEPP